MLTEFDPQSLDGNVPKIELYDLANDPDEVHNLANEQVHHETTDRLLIAFRN